MNVFETEQQREAKTKKKKKSVPTSEVTKGVGVERKTATAAREA